MILIFISEFNNKKIINNIHNQLTILSTLVELKIIVLFESLNDYDEIYKLFKNSKIHHEKLNISNIDFVKKKLNYDNNYLEKYIKSLNLKLLIVNLNTGSFRSKFLKIIQNISDKNNIKLLLPFNTLFRGRVSLYDSIFLSSNKLSDLFNEKIDYDDLNMFKATQNYINNYLRFEDSSKIRMERFQRNKSNYLNSFLQNLLFLNLKKKITNKYFLLLLPKFNNWYNSYANSENNNFINLIIHVRKIIPKDILLIVKIHPKQKLPLRYLLFFLINNNKILIFQENFNLISNHNLIKNSKLVFSAGTTAIVLPLLLMKKIIEIGSNSYYLGFKNSPFKKISILNDITKNKKIVDNIIRKENIDKIFYLKYIFSVLHSSFSIVDEEDNYNIDFKKNINSTHITLKKISNFINNNI